MLIFIRRVVAKGLERRGVALSAAAHLALLWVLVSGVSGGPVTVSYKLPGTAMGDTALVFYAPGSSRPVSAERPQKARVKPRDPDAQKPVPSVTPVAQAQAADTHAGIGTATESGLGEGDITIALETYFPYPKPDLSSLPHGTKGDVILDAVIDEHGKISGLTLLKGLGSPVDESVIATVEQWTYTPAKRNGVPVASERELHFHYERG